MDVQGIFKFFNYVILLPWVLMVFFPKLKATKVLVSAYFPVVLLAFSYLVLMLWDMFIVQGGGIDFTSFESVKKAFGRDEVLLIGWLHYLAFDLFVGIWAFEDAQKKKIPHYFLAPCLVLTLMFGPIGWLLYWLLSRFLAKK